MSFIYCIKEMEKLNLLVMLIKDFCSEKTEESFYSEFLAEEKFIGEKIDADFLLFLEEIKLAGTYPLQPYCVRAAENILDLCMNKDLPLFSFVSYVNLDEIETNNKEFQKKFEKIQSFFESDNINCDNILLQDTIKGFFGSFHITDWLKALGLRRTIGTQDILPPTLMQLWNSYQKLNHPKSKLTVGARALSKHCDRSSDNWWGVCTGNEKNKNQCAIKIFKKVLLSTVWINIHSLPHSVHVLELRCAEGYGMRWLSDGSNFRGFLEPQMTDGHEKGWIH